MCFPGEVAEITQVRTERHAKGHTSVPEVFEKLNIGRFFRCLTRLKNDIVTKSHGDVSVALYHVLYFESFKRIYLFTHLLFFENDISCLRGFVVLKI